VIRRLEIGHSVSRDLPWPNRMQIGIEILLLCRMPVNKNELSINRIIATSAEANELRGVIDVADFNDTDTLGKASAKGGPWEGSDAPYRQTRTSWTPRSIADTRQEAT
jgi:hypothetical protein